MQEEQRILFSIIIPVYNTPPSDLKRCIRSLMRNSCASWEAVLVDDGSEEETLRCLRTMARKLPGQVRVEYRQHGGAAASRNAGTRLARGRYVTCLDSDDVLLPGALDAMQTLLEAEDLDLLIARIVRSSEDFSEKMQSAGCQLGEEELKNRLRRYYLAFDRGPFQEKNAWVNRAPHGRFVKRELAQKTEFPEELLIGEDVIWNFHLLRNAGKVAVSDAPVYHYKTVSGSVTQRFHADLPEKMRRLLRAYREEVTKWPPYLQDYYEPAMLEHFSGLMRMYVFSGPAKTRRQRYIEVWNAPEWKEIFAGLHLRLVHKRFLASAILGKLRMKWVLYLVCRLHYL